LHFFLLNSEFAPFGIVNGKQIAILPHYQHSINFAVSLQCENRKEGAQKYQRSRCEDGNSIKIAPDQRPTLKKYFNSILMRFVAPQPSPYWA